MLGNLKFFIGGIAALSFVFSPAHASNTHTGSPFKQDATTRASDTQRSILAVDKMLEQLVCSNVEQKVWLEGLYSAARQPINPANLKEVFEKEEFYYTLLPIHGQKVNSKQISETYNKVSQISESLEDIITFFTSTIQRAYTAYSDNLKSSGKKPMSIDKFVVGFAKGFIRLKHPKTGQDYKEHINTQTKLLSKLTKDLEYGCNQDNNFIYRKGSKLGSSIDLNSYVIPATTHTRKKVSQLAVAQKDDESTRLPAAVLSEHKDAEQVAHDRYNIDSISSRIKSTQSVGATFYYTPQESDKRFAGAKTRTVYGTNNKKIAKVTPAFYAALVEQGAGILSNGKTINYIKTKNGIRMFKFTDSKYGLGKANNPLVPWRSLAVDFDYFKRKGIHLKIGQKVFLPSTYGLKIPGTNTYHNGVWEFADVGSKIKKARIDVFTGTMHWKDALRYVKDSSNYNDGKRNKDAEKLGDGGKQVALQLLR